MSIPAFPEKPEGYTIEDSISQILTSIAMEEIGLSHIINSEGEKLQYVMGTLPGSPPASQTIPELLEVNESVRDMLDAVTTNQMFLYGKMTSALNAYFKNLNRADSGGDEPVNPVLPSKPVDVVITADKGFIIGDNIYLRQGTETELTAIVITSGDRRAVWSSGKSAGLAFISNANKAVVSADGSASPGSRTEVKAVSAADSGKYDSKTLIVIDADIKDMLIGGDGKLYAGYGDNTFKEMSPDGTVTGELFCGGLDRTPGTAGDRWDVAISASGVKYLGPNADDSYQKAGPDGLLGTEDDVFVWKSQSENEIEPCNETADPPEIKARDIIVRPSSAKVVKGGFEVFSAEVRMSDGSPDPAGVTWEVLDVYPEGSSVIDQDGKLSVGTDAVRVTVAALSKSNPDIVQKVPVTVLPVIYDKPTVTEGRVLTAEMTGDGASWVEIATNGDFSLILRTGYINTNAHKNVRDNPVFQYSNFGSNGDYFGSTVRARINDWFRGEADGDADNLPENARLRSFTVTNDALNALGTGAANSSGKDDGFSKPYADRDSKGLDVAFALSYGEAVGFVSKTYAWGGGAEGNSVQEAAANFGSLQMPGGDPRYNQLWLRSPGTAESMASSLSTSGRVFQTPVNDTREYGLIYPALWVYSDIFN